MPALPFGIIFLLPLSVVAGYLVGGPGTFLTLLVVFGLVPSMDLILGRDRRNPAPDDEDALSADTRYRTWTFLAVPVQLALMGWGAWAVATGRGTPLELIGLTVSVGVSGGALGINISHELVHRHARLETMAGRALLWSVGYLHWSIEHVAGHHRHVSTPFDPATSRLGESVYAFLPRTVFGGWQSAWAIERERLRRQERREWSPQNRLVQYALLTLLLVVALAGVLGPWAVLFWLGQATVAIALLEVVNYIEHYGLRRRRGADGRYERVTPGHSWNASELVTNYFLFNLQRHSDHHAAPRRRYQVLRHLDEAPQLPTGYAGMILLALVPPLWFRIMDPRVPEEMKQIAREER